MEEKRAIVEQMISNGYHMMGRTIDSMVNDFTLEDLKDFLQNFMEYKRGK